MDNHSGYTDIVAPLTAGKKPDQVQDEYWLSTYVRIYESYNWSSQTSNYALIKLFSYSDPFTEYKNFQLSSKGYTEILGKNRQIRTKINHIVPMRAAIGKELQADKEIKAYQVRFTKTILDRHGNPDPQSQVTHWLATVSFDYHNPSVTQEERWLNPLEFGVHAYSKTQEVKGG
nr:type IV secretion system protein [Candidatus Hamiltonella defensa]